MIRSYRELTVYQKSYDLALEIYKITQTFPPETRFGLAAQLQRAVISIPANIAEGSGRGHTKEYIQFLRVALGSLNEVRVYFDLSIDLSFINNQQYSKISKDLKSTSQMLNALIISLAQNNK